MRALMSITGSLSGLLAGCTVAAVFAAELSQIECNVVVAQATVTMAIVGFQLGSKLRKVVDVRSRSSAEGVAVGGWQSFAGNHDEPNHFKTANGEGPVGRDIMTQPVTEELPFDGWGCRQDLMTALEDERVVEFVGVTPQQACAMSFQPTDAGRAAAWLVAEGLGYCRLFGVSLGEADGPLSVAMAIAAAQELQRDLELATERSQSLREDWFDLDEMDGDERCLSLLELRMDAWAILRVLDEAYWGCLDATGFDPIRLRNELNALCCHIDTFDGMLEEHIDLLATVADATLLANWRAFLADEFQDCLPWWLDGTLEEEALKTDRIAAAALPEFDVARYRWERIQSLRAGSDA